VRPLDPAVLAHLRPARRTLVVVVAAGLVGGLLAVAQAVALGTTLVRLVSDPAGGAWHAPAAWFAAAVAGRALAGWVGDSAATSAAGAVALTLRRRLLDAALLRDAAGPARRSTAALAVLATRGVGATEPYLTRYLPTLVLAGVLPAVTVAVIAWTDWISGLVVLLTLPLVPVFAVLIGLTTRERADRQWNRLQALAGHFLDVVRGLPTLVAHRRATAQSDAVRRVTDDYRRATADTLKVAFLSSAVLELVATLSVALVAVTVGLRLAHGAIGFETAMVVLLLAPEAYWPLRRVGAEFHAAAEGTAAFAQADEVLGTPARARVGLRPTAPVPVVVRGLRVTYPGRERPALDGVDLVVPARGLTVLTGPSGCGKSTLLDVLLGRRGVDEGEVLVGPDAVPLAEVSLAAWRDLVAWSAQRPWLRSGSIAQNLRVARPTAHDDELWAALERVALREVVAGLPGGLDARLAEDGAGLSAGQRARLALARVVLADRPLVVLDEPTAHLDDATEDVLLRTLTSLARERAVVVVAHSPRVVALADHLVVLPPATAGPVPAPASVTRRTPAPVRTEPTPGRWGERTGLLLGAASVASGVALTATASWLITRASAEPPVLYLMVAVVGVRLFGLARPVLRYAERLVSHDAALRVLAEQRARVYDRLVPLVPGALGVAGTRRGELLTAVVDDVDAEVDERLRVRQPRRAAALVAVATAGFAALLDPAAGAVVALGCAVAGLALPLAAGVARACEPDLVRDRAVLSRRVEQVLADGPHLVHWDAWRPALDLVDAVGRDLAGAAARSARGVAAARALPLLAGAGGLLLAAAVLGPRYPAGSATLALLVMLPIALVDAFTPLADAGALGVRTAAARARLDALADRPPAVAPGGGALVAGARPAVEVEAVTAGWGRGPVLRDLDLALRPGERVAVVGPSGCGKSTLAALLLRFVDPAAGAVLLDRADLRAVDPDEVRRVTGLVDDDPHVFATTVAENVRLARPDADDDAVAAALERAGLGTWVRSLPDGIATFVGEGHADVSGGERARLALARSLLADPPVLVLDEPTAHLDTATAEAIARDVLADGDRTVLWITHARTGLDLVDRVVALGPAVTDEPARARRSVLA
jgi:ATP-binding cassette subfamily C protein CydCD